MRKYAQAMSCFSRRKTICTYCLTLIFAILILLVCAENKVSFLVRVLDTEGQPVEGAHIAGGFDWTAFDECTNAQGWALLPGYARGEHATITKNNFYPYIIEHLAPGWYWIEPTPQKLELIGDIAGGVVRLEAKQIITLGYGGMYHVYSYDDKGVNELISKQLPPLVRFFKLYGDTLWLSTHDAGFYAYSIPEPLQPQFICHVDIPGYTIRPFAVRDSILAVDEWSGPLKIFSFSYEGDYHELACIGDFAIHEMVFILHYLVAIGAYEILPMIYDLQDPTDPQLIYQNSESVGWLGFFYNTYLVLQDLRSTDSPTYKVLDMNDPANPQTLGTFDSDAFLTMIINDSTAIGLYHYRPVAVLCGYIKSGFSTVATVSEDLYGGGPAGFPPYYIIGGKLWKLVDR